MTLETTFNEEGQFASVWLGVLGTREAFDSFLAEQYDDDRDEEPISAFGAEVNLKSYDHDFLESSFHAAVTSAAAFDGHSYAESFAKAAWLSASELSDRRYDSIFILYGYDHSGRQPLLRTSEHLAFLGTFTYQE